ncbi:uncharacterized protein METZ01_LOCUS108308, partial [marine metagenome]
VYLLLGFILLVNIKNISVSETSLNKVDN